MRYNKLIKISERNKYVPMEEIAPHTYREPDGAIYNNIKDDDVLDMSHVSDWQALKLLYSMLVDIRSAIDFDKTEMAVARIDEIDDLDDVKFENEKLSEDTYDITVALLNSILLQGEYII